MHAVYMHLATVLSYVMDGLSSEAVSPGPPTQAHVEALS